MSKNVTPFIFLNIYAPGHFTAGNLSRVVDLSFAKAQYTPPTPTGLRNCRVESRRRRRCVLDIEFVQFCTVAASRMLSIGLFNSRYDSPTVLAYKYVAQPRLVQ